MNSNKKTFPWKGAIAGAVATAGLVAIVASSWNSFNKNPSEDVLELMKDKGCVVCLAGEGQSAPYGVAAKIRNMGVGGDDPFYSLAGLEEINKKLGYIGPNQTMGTLRKGQKFITVEGSCRAENEYGIAYFPDIRNKFYGLNEK